MLNAPKSYMADGPAYDGENIHTAMGRNTAYSVAGHLLNTATQGVSPGSPIEDEPVDNAERDAQHAAQNAAGDTQGGPAPTYSFSYDDTAGGIRSSLRPGA